MMAPTKEQIEREFEKVFQRGLKALGVKEVQPKRTERAGTMRLESLADWQGLLAHRMYQILEALDMMDNKDSGRMDAVEMTEDFMSDADMQIRQLCNRANKLRWQIEKMKNKEAGK